MPITGLSADTGDFLELYIWVPQGATDLRFEISGGSGDADLYTRFDAWPTTSDYDCRPYVGGNAESCDFAAPSSGWWYVHLRAYSSFSGVTASASFESGGGSTVPNACGSSGPVTSGQLQDETAICLGASSQALYYYLWVADGTTAVTVSTGNGTGNADLRVKSGGWPSSTDYDAQSTGSGNADSVTVNTPPSGWFYVAVIANPSFDGASLIVDLQ